MDHERYQFFFGSQILSGQYVLLLMTGDMPKTIQDLAVISQPSLPQEVNSILPSRSLPRKSPRKVYIQ